MILGTAGHVDHGKTALVRALTGIDTDRLAEERRRGMTIDLGFAYAGEGAARIGIVDVPGHERFIATMVAGAAGIQAVLLCVAADEGPRAQTREHLRVLDLLGVARGIVVLTRADRAEPTRIAAVEAEMRALLAGTTLADAAMLAVSAVTGEGMDPLTAAIAALRRPAPAPAGRARLAVDRAFVIDGAGVIAAGLLSAGRLALGDAVVVSPAGIPARVRGLRANDRPVDAAAAGARVAVNLAGEGIAAGVVERGDWIVAPGLHMPTARVDARLVGLDGRPPRAGTLHVGAAHVAARVDPLGEGLAALTLGRALPLLAGDRVLLRGPAGGIACGGIVLDPAPPARGRRTPGR
ncbi:selenocysteine-specific translation elongation factor, partial [Elioraea sp.]|uniref:selenocysteine-specific translation elongation factor n=1 Tax=Elioraea sp. TaxID=2185103 RepID=UPI003F72152E